MSSHAMSHVAKLLEKSEAERKRLAKKCNRLLKRAKHSWARHRSHKKDTFGGGVLPVPRLQMTYRDLRGDWSYFEVRYALFTKHFQGFFVEIPLGVTRIGPGTPYGGPKDHNGKLYSPFRDGVHLHHDTEHLGLSAFRIWGEIVERVGEPLGAP